jgi:bifunctional DNA-binding transcriptional regulator/antitoxin component of YhaV-PrlF toxin-antitoxin module
MSKVTSKLQVTVPKDIAERYAIRPGTLLDWVPAGDTLRVVPANAPAPADDADERLRRFDEATARRKKRGAGPAPRRPAGKGRGWKREDLYDRGLSR